MTVVDSSVWIDFFNGKINRQTDLLDFLLDDELIVVGDLILAEVLQGFHQDKDFKQAKSLLESCIYYDMIGKINSIKSAENYRFLRSQGVTIRKTIDVLIGTFCIENNFPLLHNDKDFDPLERFLNLTAI